MVIMSIFGISNILALVIAFDVRNNGLATPLAVKY